MQLIGQQVELFSPYCIFFKYLTINKTYSFSENSGLEKSSSKHPGQADFLVGQVTFLAYSTCPMVNAQASHLQTK